nr:hypothetical protein [Tanacetum cinerariifolium]
MTYLSWEESRLEQEGEQHCIQDLLCSYQISDFLKECLDLLKQIQSLHQSLGSQFFLLRTLSIAFSSAPVLTPGCSALLSKMAHLVAIEPSYSVEPYSTLCLSLQYHLHQFNCNINTSSGNLSASSWNTSNINFTFSTVGKFKQWKFRIQRYLQNEHYALWEVIEFGDSYKDPQKEATSESSAKKKGRTFVITTKDMQKRRNDVKARTTLLLALPDEHQLRFSKYETAQELWGAILKTFGGNEATKKTKKNQLKQRYGNFKAKGSENLEQTFNRLHTIVSHLEFMNVEIEQDDLNQIFLTSLAPEWLMADRFWKKAGKKITIQGTDVAGFDKSMVECFNCHKMGHFARESRVSRIQDRGRRESYRQGFKEEEPASKAQMAKSFKARFFEFKTQEIKFCEKIRGLEFDVECHGCGQPCDGYYCESCTCLQCGMTLFNGIYDNCIYGAGMPIICTECGGIDSNIHQLIEECSIEVPEQQKQKMEDTMFEFVKICQQKEFLCIHDDVDDLIESALDSKLLSINSINSQQSNAENLLPIPSKCEVTLEDEIKCDMPAKDVCSPIFTTFSNPLFKDDGNFDSSDDESLPDEDRVKTPSLTLVSPFRTDESALDSKLLSINSQRLDKKEQKVKNVEEQPAERRNRAEKSLQNFRVVHKSSISFKNTSQISSIHSIAPILSTK